MCLNCPDFFSCPDALTEASAFCGSNNRELLDNEKGEDKKIYISMQRHHGETALKNLFAKTFNTYIATGEM